MLLVITCTVCTLLSGSTVPALAASNSANGRSIGISVNAILGAPDSKVSKEFSNISKLGFTTIRTDFLWYNIQPNDTPTYDWTPYDHMVSLAQNYHLKVLGILDYSPAWASIPNCNNISDCAPNNPAQFAAFASATAFHFKNSVQSWEIWNEENDSAFWGTYPNPNSYTSLLKLSYPAIKEANPNATVITGGLSASQNSLTNEDPVKYLQQLYASGAKQYFDAVGYHPYTYPSTAFDPNNGWAKMDATNPSLRSVMVANNDSNKQIWITEYGAPTNGPSPSQFVGQNSQAQEVLYSYIAIQGKSWIGPFFWYTYQDAGTSTASNQNFFGIVSASGGKKLSYDIWQSLLAQ